MSNKNWESLHPLDRLLRQRQPVGMRDGVDCTITITKRTGFELFNTRAYHNYETWSSGYYITHEQEGNKTSVEAEDLDDAITKLINKLSTKDA